MNAKQAKLIDFPDLLAQMGYRPIRSTKGGRELWYSSPFRQEKDASFHTSFINGKWIWKDFGDEGGNVIDFIMRHEGVPFRDALAFIRSRFQGPLLDYKRTVPKSEQQLPLSFKKAVVVGNGNEPIRELIFKSAGPICHPAIKQYLQDKRRIPLSLAQKYLHQVSYRNVPKNRDFFAFGMQNNSGGYEIRAASDTYSFKSALIKRDISLIPGREEGADTIAVFEGMTDFLSYLAWQDQDCLCEDAIILHSVSSLNKAVFAIEQGSYSIVRTYLDNDKTGHKATRQLQERLINVSVIPQNAFYASAKDVNEAWVKRHLQTSPTLVFNKQ
ncbi:MAG: toprim domain-containing protein [Bacteroidota bacterium]